MKLSEAFPSKYLKAADLHGRRVVVTIDSLEMANIGDDTDKLVVYFKGKDKGVVLNVTNANMIAEIAGTEETDEWLGKQIVLYSTKVDFQGRRVDAIRVDYPPAPATAPATGNGQRSAPSTRSSTSTPTSEREVGADDDDQIPW